MWDNDLEIAKQYIKQKRYSEARDILVMMPDNHIAQDWLQKLDRIQYGQPQDFSRSSNPVVINQTIQQVTQLEKNRGCFGDIPSVPMVLIILNMILWGGVVIAGAFTESPETGAGALIGVPVFFAIAFLLYYLYWKFYWWMLAISWTLLTVLTICSVIYAVQNPTAFMP